MGMVSLEAGLFPALSNPQSKSSCYSPFLPRGTIVTVLIIMCVCVGSAASLDRYVSRQRPVVLPPRAWPGSSPCSVQC